MLRSRPLFVALFLELLRLTGAVELSWKVTSDGKHSTQHRHEEIPSSSHDAAQILTRPRLMREAAVEEDGFVRFRHPKHSEPASGNSDLLKGIMLEGLQVPTQEMDDPNQTSFQAAYSLPEDTTPYGNNTIVRVRADYGLPDENPACSLGSPWFTCLLHIGYLGPRRLVSPGLKDAAMLGLLRPSWMADPAVKRQRIFDLTFPGTINSGAYNFYDPRGQTRVAQTYDISGQLYIGVRAFDLKISWDDDSEQLIVSNMYLMTPLDEVLYQFRDFLTKFPSEVVMISAEMDPNAEQVTDMYVAPFMLEDNDMTSVPGQGVATALLEVFPTNLSTWFNLQKLPAPRENPSISELLGVGIRIVYFWKGQQVLCGSLMECASIPGWRRPFDDGTNAIPKYTWQPVPIGVRTPSNLSVEPGCIMNSDSIAALSSAQSEEDFADSAKSFLIDPPTQATNNRPTCLPRCWNPPGEPPVFGGWPCTAVPIPVIGSPTLLYWLNAKIPGVDEVPPSWKFWATDARASAERVNYLVLKTLMNRNMRPSFAKANVIAFSYVHPALVHRIIESNLDSEECGFSVACKITGSCWAMSHLNPNVAINMTCMPDKGVGISMIAYTTNQKVLLVMTFLIMVGSCGCCCFTCLMFVGCAHTGVSRLKKTQAQLIAEAEAQKEEYEQAHHRPEVQQPS